LRCDRRDARPDAIRFHESLGFLGQYLADVLHESATPSNNEVVKVDRRK